MVYFTCPSGKLPIENHWKGAGPFQKKTSGADWTNLPSVTFKNQTNQISSLPVEPGGNGPRLPIGGNSLSSPLNPAVSPAPFPSKDGDWPGHTVSV